MFSSVTILISRSNFVDKRAIMGSLLRSLGWLAGIDSALIFIPCWCQLPTNIDQSIMYKKIPFCIFAVLLVCFASTFTFAEQIKKDISTTIVDLPIHFKNVKTIRTIDLRSTVAREDIGIRAENIDNQPQNVYYVPLPEEYDEKVAHFAASLKVGSKDALPVEKLGFDSARYIQWTYLLVFQIIVRNEIWHKDWFYRKIQLYKITFPEPVEPGNTIAFGIKIVTTKSLLPNPEVIPQVARQHVEYTNNLFVYSLYPVDESKTTVV